MAMQPFGFALRESTVESVDGSRSRYVPSSVYSGAGTVGDDSPAIGPPHNFMSGALRGPFSEQQTPRFVAPPPQSQNGPRSSGLLNVHDPVAMHFLAETAISDSREFEVLSFEEVAQLKKERDYLRSKAETTRRKLALESKLRDAALSLNRLYSIRDPKEGGGSPNSPKRSRRSLLGGRSAGMEASSRADDEYAASTRKVEELTAELSHLDKSLEQAERRLLEHTAGILQLTHRGLKKNVRRTELPRSPESMSSQPNGRASAMDAMDDFDERSLYQVPDYVTDFGQTPRGTDRRRRSSNRETQAIDNVATRLQELNLQLHSMITQSGSQAHFDPPPQPGDDDMIGRVGAQIQAHLGYLSQGLDAMGAAQGRSNAAAQQSILDSEDQLEDVNIRLHDMLERTNSVSHSPLLQQDEPRGKDLQSQLAFSSLVIDRLNQRVEHLVEQKDILTRQILQQRELNSKSDAERDTEIRALTDELEETKRSQALGDEEVQHSRGQINLLMEQLDLAKQQSVLLEQERGVNEGKAVEIERVARKEMEEKFLADSQAKQEEHASLQSEMEQLRSGHEETTAALRKQLDDLESAKSGAESELSKIREEMEGLEAEVVRSQTELTMVKAELDGAYGTRAERAADVSMNPAIQKEIDELNARNSEMERQLDLLSKQHAAAGSGSADLQNKVIALQKELKETIEEYETMTKQSIDDEKGRERMEELVDTLQQRCEAAELELSEEKVKWLGAKAGSPTDTTSTMVLKNEFKKMMRETRAENFKALKTEQEERRRLEGLVKTLRRDLQGRHGPKHTTDTENGIVEPR